MTEGCRAYEREGWSTDPALRAAWTDHMPACQSCREQDAADRALRELLGGAARPELPPFFAQQCASRARFVPSAAPLTARQRLVLRAYWILAAIVAYAVLAHVAWWFRTDAGGGSRLLGSLVAVPPALAAAAAVTTATVLTPVFLLAHLRGGLLALMYRMLGRTS
jgi:hypothetical protein